jgi:phage repressor protein C with HTH and peptisase S24 domain
VAYSIRVAYVNRISVGRLHIVLAPTWSAVLPDTSTPGERLRGARISANYASAAKAAEALGVGVSTYAGHENGQNDFNREQAVFYARKFKVSPAWLMFGDDFAPIDPRLGMPKSRAKGQGVIVPTMPAINVPDLAIHAGMGGGGNFEVRVDQDGRPVDPEQVRGFWSFPEYTLRQFGDLRKVYAWEARGDSMEPTLPGGSVVFVDISQRSPPPDDIYAIDAGDGLVVKRVRLIPRTDRVEIISDNKSYPADTLLRDEVTIWGRVIGAFQWRG